MVNSKNWEENTELKKTITLNFSLHDYYGNCYYGNCYYGGGYYGNGYYDYGCYGSSHYENGGVIAICITFQNSL